MFTFLRDSHLTRVPDIQSRRLNGYQTVGVPRFRVLENFVCNFLSRFSQSFHLCLLDNTEEMTYCRYIIPSVGILDRFTFHRDSFSFHQPSFSAVTSFGVFRYWTKIKFAYHDTTYSTHDKFCIYCNNVTEIINKEII